MTTNPEGDWKGWVVCSGSPHRGGSLYPAGSHAGFTKQMGPDVLTHSYGFRPGRSAHQAIAQAQKHIAEGYRYVVDIDLEKFFDRVCHDKLMGLIAKRVGDKRILKLIRAFLTAGVMENGLVSPSEEGTPQGGPLTPLTQRKLLIQGQNMAHGNFLCLGVHDHFLH